MTATLTDLPSPLSLYLKAAASASRSPGNLRQLPPLALRLAAVQPDPARLAAYCEVCGIEPSEFLPITYPQVAVTALHMALMTQPKFPLPMLGLVHVSNRIEQFRPIGVGEAWDAEVRIGECREVRAGLEFDLLTDVSVGEERVWTAVTTIIHRRKSGGKADSGRAPRPSAPAAEAPRLADYHAIRAAADTGRRYAKVSGDYNPIHLYAATAKLFGFPRAIAHGMWSLARCLGVLEGQLPAAPTVLEVKFKQPVLLPAAAALKFHTEDDGVHFWMLAQRSNKVHLSGVLR
jgi:acyl dehydratase